MRLIPISHTCHTLTKLTLAPLLLRQGRTLRRTIPRLPEPTGDRSGLIPADLSQPPLTILFLGDSTMAGVGARHQSTALATLTATLLAERLRRSILWQMVARSGINTTQILTLARETTLAPPDIVITALGGNDVLDQVSPTRFLRGYQQFYDELRATLAPTARLIISGLPPLHMTPAVPQPLRWFFGRYARLLDRRLKRWTSATPGITYLSLDWAAQPTRLASDRFHPGERLYQTWASLLADQAALLFPRATVASALRG